MEITEAVARKVVEVVDAGLVGGVGKPIPGQMCVEAAVCYAMGLPHGDEPSCVSPTLRRLKIALNDKAWSSPQARAQGLRRLAVAQLGSAGALDEAEFRRRVVDVTIRKAVPVGLRAAAAMQGNAAHAEALEAAAVRCEQEGTREACRHARETARAAYAAYAATAAATDAAYAAYAAASAATYATYTATAAATYVAYAAYAARDRVLSQYAEWIVEILIDMQAPGCQWLPLTPKVSA